MATGTAKTSSSALTDFRDVLLKLSGTLYDIFDLLHTDMSQLEDKWKDVKYKEFIDGYQPQIKKCEKTSNRYRVLCEKTLNPMIGKVETIEQQGFSVNDGGTGTNAMGSTNTGFNGTDSSGSGHSSIASGLGPGAAAASAAGIVGGAGAAFASAAGVGIAGGAGAAFASAAGAGIAGDGKFPKNNLDRKSVYEMTDEELLSECTEDQIKEYKKSNVDNKSEFLKHSVLVNRARENGIEISSDSIDNLACHEVFGEDYLARDTHGIYADSTDFTIRFNTGHTSNNIQSETQGVGMKISGGKGVVGSFSFGDESESSKSRMVGTGYEGYSICKKGTRTYPDVYNMSNDDVMRELPNKIGNGAQEQVNTINHRHDDDVKSWLSNPHRNHYSDSQMINFYDNKQDAELRNLYKDIKDGNDIRRSEGEPIPPRPRKSIATMACEDRMQNVPIGENQQWVARPGTSKSGCTIKLGKKEMEAYSKKRTIGESGAIGISFGGQQASVQIKESTTDSTTETIQYATEACIVCDKVDK